MSPPPATGNMTAETIAVIENPIDRVTEAAALMKTLKPSLDRERAKRAVAVGVAQFDHKIPHVDIYKHALGIPRVLYYRILSRVPADGKRVEMKAPLSAAKTAHARVVQLEEQIEHARITRDDTAIDLMDGLYGRVVSNADVARATGLTTARVSQLRTKGKRSDRRYPPFTFPAAEAPVDAEAS